jgi:hypothetical protein
MLIFLSELIMLNCSYFSTFFSTNGLLRTTLKPFLLTHSELRKIFGTSYVLNKCLEIKDYMNGVVSTMFERIVKTHSVSTENTVKFG